VSYETTGRTGFSRRGLSKAAIVYDDLRTAIIGLELKPGARIDKHALCERLGVSRQPLSEAIARLADERLLDVEPQNGTFVARIRMSDVVDGAFIRRALEVATVEAIAANVEAATLKRLERNLDYQAAALKAADWEEFYVLDVRFHAALFDRLARRRVAEVVETSRAQLERIRRLMVTEPGRAPGTFREHRAIYAALKARSAAEAGAAMGAHLDAVMLELRRFATRQPELFEP
jgi:DNA-binding GntR family transcriptional regulator